MQIQREKNSARLPETIVRMACTFFGISMKEIWSKTKFSPSKEKTTFFILRMLSEFVIIKLYKTWNSLISFVETSSKNIRNSLLVWTYISKYFRVVSFISRLKKCMIQSDFTSKEGVLRVLFVVSTPSIFVLRDVFWPTHEKTEYCSENIA